MYIISFVFTKYLRLMAAFFAFLLHNVKRRLLDYLAGSHNLGLVLVSEIIRLPSK